VRDDIEKRKQLTDTFSETTLERLRLLLRHVVDAECMIEAVRHKIDEGTPLPLRNVFDELDDLKKGCLTATEVRRFFDNYPAETEPDKKKGLP